MKHVMLSVHNKDIGSASNFQVLGKLWKLVQHYDMS